jgi:hypothetical protein
MKILLVNSWIYDFAVYDLWMKPLGLLYIAAFLEEFGYDVSLINCMDRHQAASQTLDKIFFCPMVLLSKLITSY